LSCASALADSGSGRAAELIGECVKAVQYMDAPDAEPNAVDLVYGNRCTHYISGVRDAFTATNKACVPQNVSAGQLARMAVKFGNEHPAILSQHKVHLVVMTMMSNYPCSKAE
jgi:hypothetical protein